MVGLALLLDPTCVGNCLALTGASPGRPDVEEHGLAAERCERRLPTRDALGLRSGGAGWRVAAAAVATTTRARQSEEHEGESPYHRSHGTDSGLLLPGRFESCKDCAVGSHSSGSYALKTAPGKRRYRGNAAHSRAYDHHPPLARRCGHVHGVAARRAAVDRGRRPVRAGWPIVGRRADQGRHVGRDSRYRSSDLQARPTRSRAGSWLRRSRRGESVRRHLPIPTRLVTMRELDAQLVGALGLSEAAKRIRSAAQVAGLAPTGMLGTETVARLLGLRLNHPQGQDQLELLPNQPATRAEAAYSFARALKLSAGQVALLDTLSQTFSVPEIGEWQRIGADAGTALRRVSVRLGRNVRVDAEALERHRSRRDESRSRVASTARASSGGCTRRSRIPVHPSSATCSREDDVLDERRSEEGGSHRDRASSQPGRRHLLRQQGPASRRRPRSGTPASTSGTAGSCTPRVPASRCSRSRAGTRRPLPGRGGRSPKPGCSSAPPASPAIDASVGRVRLNMPALRPTSGALPAQCLHVRAATVQSGSPLPRGPFRAEGWRRLAVMSALRWLRGLSARTCRPTRTLVVASFSVLGLVIAAGAAGLEQAAGGAQAAAESRRGAREHRPPPEPDHPRARRPEVRRRDEGNLALARAPRPDPPRGGGRSHPLRRQRRESRAARPVRRDDAAGRSHVGAPTAPDCDRPGRRRDPAYCPGRGRLSRRPSSAVWAQHASARKRARRDCSSAQRGSTSTSLPSRTFRLPGSFMALERRTFAADAEPRCRCRYGVCAGPRLRPGRCGT